MNFAGSLKAENIPVSLLVTTDPARITGDVPLNVERFINIFQSNSLLGGIYVPPGQGYRGHYASYDLVEHSEITHVNMEKTETIQDQLVTKNSTTIDAAKIRRRGGAALLRRAGGCSNRVVGQRHVGVRSCGRYAATLAAQYHVPLWSIAQINRVSEGASLTAGQRIGVPRHLNPPTASNDGAVSTQAPPKR